MSSHSVSLGIRDGLTRVDRPTSPNSANMRALYHIVIVCAVIGIHALTWAAERPPAEADVGRPLQEMFKIGFARGADPHKEVSRYYEAAKAASNDDPRVDYAYGLVLLKQLRNKEALAQFQAITKRPGAEYWPAWQALIWMHFVTPDPTAGYDCLKDFTDRVARLRPEDEPVARELLAQWIGQVLEALQISAETPKQREMILNAEESLTNLLGPDLQASLARGRASVQLLNSTGESDIKETREIAKEKQKEEIATAKDQIAKELEASTEKRSDLKKSAESMKKDFEKLQSNLGTQLSRLERDYDFQQKRAMALSASQLQVVAELQFLEQQANDTTRRRARLPGQPTLDAFETRKVALEAQQIKYQLEFEQVAIAASVVTQRAAALINQRNIIVQQYEKASGQLVQRDAALDKWQERRKKDEENLKIAAKNKPKVVLGKIQRNRAFRTYIDIDLIAERDRLLEEFSGSDSSLPQ